MVFSRVLVSQKPSHNEWRVAPLHARAGVELGLAPWPHRSYACRMREQDAICYEVWLQGRVQGVGFRYATRQQALRLGLRGWVRNCDDGSVEARIHGEPARVRAMLEWLAEGPALAHVEHMSFAIAPPEETVGFEIR